MKSVLRGVVLFFLTFIIGSLFASLYFSKKELLTKPQVFIFDKSQIKSSALPKCINPLDDLKLTKIILMKEIADLTNQFADTKDVFKKQKSELGKKLADKKKELEEIESRIKYWDIKKNLRKRNPADGDLTVKLLHKEPCYD